MTLSKRLPDSWVKSLLNKLRAIYGSRFDYKWKGIDTDEMVDMWAQALGAYDGERIKWALEQCMVAHTDVPNLPEFVQLVKSAPRPELPKLPEPQVPPEVARERVEKVEQTFNDILSQPRDYKAWAKRLRDREAAGEKLSHIQMQAWREALNV